MSLLHLILLTAAFFFQADSSRFTYFFNEIEWTNFENALSQCQLNEKRLVRINSEDILEELKLDMSSQGLDSDYEFWVDATRTGGVPWHYADTSIPVPFRPWIDGQPNNEGDCAILVTSQNFGIDDVNCTGSEIAFVCETPVLGCADYDNKAASFIDNCNEASNSILINDFSPFIPLNQIPELNHLSMHTVSISPLYFLSVNGQTDVEIIIYNITSVFAQPEQEPQSDCNDYIYTCPENDLCINYYEACDETICPNNTDCKDNSPEILWSRKFLDVHFEDNLKDYYEDYNEDYNEEYYGNDYEIPPFDENDLESDDSFIEFDISPEIMLASSDVFEIIIKINGEEQNCIRDFPGCVHVNLTYFNNNCNLNENKCLVDYLKLKNTEKTVIGLDCDIIDNSITSSYQECDNQIEPAFTETPTDIEVTIRSIYEPAIGFFYEPAFDLHCAAQNNDEGIVNVTRNGELVYTHSVFSTESMYPNIFHSSIFQLQGYYTCIIAGEASLQDQIVETDPALITVADFATFYITLKMPSWSFNENLTINGHPDYEKRKQEIDEFFQNQFFLSDVEVSVPKFGQDIEWELNSFSSGSVIADITFGIYKSAIPEFELFQNISDLLLELEEVDSATVINTWYCKSEITFYNGIQLIWNVTIIGTTTYPQESVLSTGIFVSRTCMGDFITGAVWGTPVSYSIETDINDELSELSQIEVTTENVESVATTVTLLTSEPEKLNVEGVIAVGNLLEKITNVNIIEVAQDVVKIVDNIMQVKEDIIQQSQVGAKIVSTFETFAHTVSLDAVTNDFFRDIEYSLGLETWTADLDAILSLSYGVSYASIANSNDSNDNLATYDVSRYSNFYQIPIDSVDVSINLPNEVFNRSSTADGIESNRVSFIIYQSDALFSSALLSERSTDEYSVTVNTRVISGQAGGKPILNLSSPVTIIFFPLENTYNNYTECVFWDFEVNNSVGGWSSEGCQFKGLENGRVICECYHLTNFAVLMSISQPVPGIHDTILTYISKIGIGISIVALFITILSFLIFEKLRRSVPQKILISLCTALFCLLIVYIIGIEETSNRAGCMTICFLLHYFLLATFSWMSVEAYNMYLAFVKVVGVHISRFFLKSSIFAWVTPFIIAIITIFIEKDSYISDKYCFMVGLRLYTAVLIPLGISLIFNTTSFVLVLRALTCTKSVFRKETSKPSWHANIQRFRRAVMLEILLGITWVFGYLAIDEASLAFQYIFCIFNSFQGLFIFIFYCAMQKDVRDEWRSHLFSKSKRYELSKKRKGKAKEPHTPDTSLVMQEKKSSEATSLSHDKSHSSDLATESSLLKK